MNAGAYGGEMKDIVTRVWLMSPDGKEETVRTGAEMEFAYRNSCLQRTGEIVTKVELKLQPEDAEAIQARIAELTEKRVHSRVPEAAGEFPECGKHLQASGGRIRGSADSGIRIEGRFRRRCRGIGEAFRFHHQQGWRHGDGCAAADGAGREEGI